MSAVQNVADDHLALQGYDPVSYFDGTPTEGEAGITSEHDGAVYRFANQANKDRFDAAPADYAPQYGGWCAVAASEGKYFPVNPETYEISDNKLYLFYNGEQGNTLPQWEEDRENRRATADKHWAEGTLEDHE
ncbi:MAG: YHS domain-containing protein [Phycisphaera sp.]|nr:MAG: YHS domain-containing protein [Phycisphaera sp.]